jgi:hypothetical protein
MANPMFDLFGLGQLGPGPIEHHQVEEQAKNNPAHWDEWVHVVVPDDAPAARNDEPLLQQEIGLDMSDLDMLCFDDVVLGAVQCRQGGNSHIAGPHSYLCSLMTVALVFDMVVKAHCLHRLQRQFGRLQFFPRPRAIDVVPWNAYK